MAILEAAMASRIRECFLPVLHLPTAGYDLINKLMELCSTARRGASILKNDPMQSDRDIMTRYGSLSTNLEKHPMKGFQ